MIIQEQVPMTNPVDMAIQEQVPLTNNIDDTQEQDLVPLSSPMDVIIQGETPNAEPLDDCPEGIPVTDSTAVESKKEPQKIKYRKLQTAGLYTMMFGFGMINALYGSCLLSLKGLYSADTAALSVALACLSAGLMLGDLVCGGVFDRVNSSIVMGGACIVLGSSTLVSPWMPSLVGFSAMATLQGFSIGFIETSLGPYMISLWSTHRAKDSIFQASYPIWSMGSFMCPLLISGFLVDPNASSANATSLLNATTPSSDPTHLALAEPTSRPSAYSMAEPEAEARHHHRHHDHPSFDALPPTNVTYNANDFTPVRYAYSSISVLTILTGVGFFIIFLIVGLPFRKEKVKRKPRPKSRLEPKPIGDAEDLDASSETIATSKTDVTPKPDMTSKTDMTPKPNVTSKSDVMSKLEVVLQPDLLSLGEEDSSHVFEYGFLTLQFVFYYIYQHVEAVMGAYIASFAVSVVDEGGVQFGAMMVSLFYGCQALGRLVGVPVAYVVGLRAVLCVNLSVMTVGHVLLMLLRAGGGGVVGDGRGILMAGVALSGLFQSTVFGSVMLFVAEYMPLTGFASAVIQIGSSTGKLVGWTLAAHLFQYHGPVALAGLLLGSCGLLLLIFAAMNAYVACMGRPKLLTGVILETTVS